MYAPGRAAPSASSSARRRECQPSDATVRAMAGSERIQELTDRVNRTEGRGVGLNAGWVYLLGALAAVGTIVSLFIAFKAGV